MLKVFQITFKENSYGLNNEYEKLSEHEKETIANILPDGYFEFNNDDDKYVLYLVITELEFKRYLQILMDNLIFFEVNLLSTDLLNGYDLDSDLSKYVNPLNSFRYNTFKKKIDEWILSNLDIDKVLDRINEVGSIDKLTKLEKNFLENYK
jgi:hypothetical protein